MTVLHLISSTLNLTHNTAMQRWGKAPQQGCTENTGAIEAPSTNHSGKNACHFPTSGTDRAGSQTCDLFCITSTAGWKQIQLTEQQRYPEQKCSSLCWQHGLEHALSSSTRPVLKIISALKCVFVIMFLFARRCFHQTSRMLNWLHITVSQHADILLQ